MHPVPVSSTSSLKALAGMSREKFLEKIEQRMAERIKEAIAFDCFMRSFTDRIQGFRNSGIEELKRNKSSNSSIAKFSVSVYPLFLLRALQVSNS